MSEELDSSSPSEHEDYKEAQRFFADAAPAEEENGLDANRYAHVRARDASISSSAVIAWLNNKSHGIDSDEEDQDSRIMADPAIAAAKPEYHQPARTMFVTIGTIASFKPLIEEVVSPKFLETLASLNYRQLIVQCGPDLEYFNTIRPQSGYDSQWIDIMGFDYTDEIHKYFLKCTPSDGLNGTEKRGMGIVMAHAGAGTILEALKVNTRTVVCPNTSLMDNHQLEFAEEYDRQGYVVMGHLGKLYEAVERLETWQPAAWPPKPPVDSKYPHVGAIIDDVIGVSVPPGLGIEVPEELYERILFYQELYQKPLDTEREYFLNGWMDDDKWAKRAAWRARWLEQRRDTKMRGMLHGGAEGDGLDGTYTDPNGVIVRRGPPKAAQTSLLYGLIFEDLSLLSAARFLAPLTVIMAIALWLGRQP